MRERERERDSGCVREKTNTGNRCLFLLPHPQGRNSCPEITVPTLQKMVNIDRGTEANNLFDVLVDRERRSGGRRGCLINLLHGVFDYERNIVKKDKDKMYLCLSLALCFF